MTFRGSLLALLAAVLGAVVVTPAQAETTSQNERFTASEEG